MIDFGDVPAGAVLPIPFASYGKTDGDSITLSGLAVTDIEVYKGTSITQRASDNGYALIDTDGIDIDGITGIHGFSIDTGDNSDSGFYAVGSYFYVVVSTVTVDTETVSFIAARFRIVAAEAIAGKPKVDVDAWLGTAAATPTVAGVPEVDVTHYAGSTTDVSTIPARIGEILTDTGTTLQGELDGIQADTEDIQARLPAALTADGNIKADTLRIGGTLQTANDVGGDVDAILVDTGTTLDGRIPAALVGGRMDSSVGAMAANVITEAATAADHVTAIQSGLSTLTAGQVNAEVLDVLNVDTFAEIGQEAPAATNTIRKMIGYLFKAWRNRSTQTSSQYSLYADDATTVDQKATTSDDGTTFSRGEVGTGP